MRKFLTTGAVLAGLLGGGWAQAGVLYAWEADCLKWTSSRYQHRDLPCPSLKVRGYIEMPDQYVPGTYYHANSSDSPPWASPLFTFVSTDPHLRLIKAEMDSQYAHITFLLPAASGSGVFSWMQEGLNAHTSGIYLESPYPGSSSMDWENMVFTLVDESAFYVPEPSSLALLGAGLLGAIRFRRRM